MVAFRFNVNATGRFLQGPSPQTLIQGVFLCFICLNPLKEVLDIGHFIDGFFQNVNDTTIIKFSFQSFPQTQFE